MDRKRRHERNQKGAKSQKSSDKNDACESPDSSVASTSAVVVGAVVPAAVVGAAAPAAVVGATVPAATIEQTGDIFKLDIDCFKKTFDYVPFNDLYFVSHTCKRLNQVAGNCFQENYQGHVICDHYGIKRQFGNTTFNMKHLVPFVQEIDVSMQGLHYFHEERSQFHELKQLQMHGSKTFDVGELKKFSMAKLEDLRLEHCNLGKKFNETIECFPNLRRLDIEICEGKYDWLGRKYPKLEYFKIVWLRCGSIKGVPAFLECNPNIRHFATNQQFLSENRNDLMTGKVKLDNLAIWMDTYGTERLCELLKSLYECGVYKKLQIYVEEISSQEQIDQLASVQGLVKLSVLELFNESFSLLALKSIEELHLLQMLDEVYEDDDYEAMATQLVHLKRIHVKEISMRSIVPFILRSVGMQQIVVETLDPYGSHVNGNVIKLRTLNSERAKLPAAQKITLYVEEKYFLATKWALGETDLALIRLKRLDSFQFDHDFYNVQPQYY